jgi:Tol biopolymer transport system component
MSCLLCRIPALRRLRRELARIFALTLVVVLAGCDDATAPADPSSVAEPAPVADAAPVADPAPVGLATVGTSRIAFMSYAGEESDIYTINPGGGGLTRLTSWAGSEWDPTWSYDHQRLAMVRWRAGVDNVMHSDIFIMNADGSNKHWARSALPVYDFFEPSWSPDGKRLVITVRIGNSSTAYLATLELSTGNLAWVAPAGMVAVQGRHASYDPSGASIIYLAPQGTSVHRFVPKGSDQTILAGAWQIRDATLSPDGTRLAYSRLYTNTNPEIFVLALATKASKRLTYSGAQDYGATWSPDGTRVAFLSNRSGRYQVWSMNAATGGSLTQVTKVVDAAEPAWWH